MKSKKRNQQADYIKANRRGSREAEIESHGRPVSFNSVHVSKKVYNRKRAKADDDRRLPYLFIRRPGSVDVVGMTGVDWYFFFEPFYQTSIPEA